MMHIAFCINDTYVMPCGVLIRSIIHYNQNPITFHVIHKNIKEKNQEMLKAAIQEYSQYSVCFHKISDQHDKQLIIREGDHVSVEAYYRFFLPDILGKDIHSVLYIDSDIICTDSLAELFSNGIPADYAVGMCYDECYSDIGRFNRLDYPQEYGYYNSGVMLINLDYWRKHNTAKKLLDFAVSYPEKCIFHDQDAINAVCYKQIYPLHPRYNCQHSFFRIYAWQQPKNYTPKLTTTDKICKSKWPEILEAAQNPCLVHFSYIGKPWFKEATVPFTKLWRYFYIRSPWGGLPIKSMYTSHFKLFKLKLHTFLSRLNIMQPVPPLEIYPEEGYQTEKNYLNALQKNHCTDKTNHGKL